MNQQIHPRIKIVTANSEFFATDIVLNNTQVPQLTNHKIHEIASKDYLNNYPLTVVLFITSGKTSPNFALVTTIYFSRNIEIFHYIEPEPGG